MDVDNQGPRGAAIPVASINFKEQLPAHTGVVPVVFIVNQVFKAIDDVNLETLANHIDRFVKGKVKQSGAANFSELQIDCDWTATTREAYFKFLKALRKRMASTIRLSATLRLHQVRNMKGSGIPPVDRAMLMCYNMGNLRQYGEHNSIISIKEINTYLKDFLLDYPLPVDIALPLFSWPVVFRKGNYMGISKQLNTDLLADTSLFHNASGSIIYRAKKFLPNTGIRVGDEVRYEQSRVNDLLEAAKFLSSHKRKEDFTLLFFHLDPELFKHYSNEQLKKIIHCF
ncbi:hypothetical protein SAMN05216436_103226 [bacterium A37T11]|nr:hypothetical protein SAMN05216436_103226 [bacterium A37T11]